MERSSDGDLVTTWRTPDIASAPGWPLVLYFHHVNVAVQHYTSITPASFRRALGEILEGFGPALDPAEVAVSRTMPDEPRVLITFDDGYRDNITDAVPILDEFGVKILLFCVTQAISGATHRQDTPRKLQPRTDYMTWSELRSLADQGHVIAAHSRTHRHLPELTAEEVKAEVRGSLHDVARHIGTAPTAFAYPYGQHPVWSALPSDVLGFGTIKSPPAPWDEEPHRIRRTYVPVDEPERWKSLIRRWRRQWFESQ